MSLRSINPATGQTVGTYDETTPEAAQRIVEHVHAAFAAWRREPLARRAELLAAAAGLLRRERDELARLMALEMGKPLREGRAEADKCAWALEHFAAHGPALLADEPVATDARRSYVTLQPLGVILAVMPWNFPLWQVIRCAAPALLAGNAVALKHASNVPGCALAIERIFRAAGFPAHLVRALLVPAAGVERLIEHPRVAAVTLTGSTPAGRAVAAAAGRALKKTVLELGGSDPYVILEDADLEQAVAAGVAGRLINGGQSCVAAKRFIVLPGVRAEFERRFVAAMAARRCGDPLDETSDIGPLARADLRDELHRQVERSVAAGAVLALGGQVPPGPGAFYPPTVLTAVGPGMPAHDEELFGPVAAIIPAADEAAALRVANGGPFGLGAAVFTRDLARGEELAARDLDAGCCFVNAFVKSDPRLPFGGIKDSGWGRELGACGIREFVNVKTVYVA